RAKDTKEVYLVEGKNTLNGGNPLFPGVPINSIELAGDGRHFWLVPYGVSGLYLVDLMEPNPGQRLLGKVGVSAVYPTEEKGYAWVIPDDSTGVYLVNVEGKVFNQGRAFLEKVKFESVVQAGDRVHSWVRPVNTRQGLYVVGTDETALEHPRLQGK